MVSLSNHAGSGVSALLVVILASTLIVATAGAARTLDIYFIDVEGGQSTLVVTPARQSLLVDAGFPGPGGFDGRPGDPQKARDATRILAAARAAGLKQIDYLLITHFHADHDGGVVELARQIPIRAFIDHGSPAPEAEERVRGTVEVFNAYSAVRAKGTHLQPLPGDRLPLRGVEATVVSSAGATLKKPMRGAGQPNPACGPDAPPAEEPTENPRSTGFLLRLGRFRFLDVGDLSGAPLFALVCPKDLIGPVSAYLVTHHAGVDAADPSTFAASRPRVAVLNNGATKGGAPETFAALRRSPGLEDAWQLHRSTRDRAENFTDERIANLDDTTSHWIKLSANEDGSFAITNGRTGAKKRYPATR